VQGHQVITSVKKVSGAPAIDTYAERCITKAFEYAPIDFTDDNRPSFDTFETTWSNPRFGGSENALTLLSPSSTLRNPSDEELSEQRLMYTQRSRVPVSMRTFSTMTLAQGLVARYSHAKAPALLAEIREVLGDYLKHAEAEDPNRADVEKALSTVLRE
jgi:hypothetical protein